MARVPADDRRAGGSFTSPYGPAEITRALGWMELGLFEAEQVKAFGATLFGALFTGDVKTVYESCRAATDRPLRYRLLVEAPETARIPWELLYDPDRTEFLCRAAPLVRGVSLTEPARPLQVEPPLRVLVVDAFPQGVPKLQDQLETTGIRKALAGLVRGGRAEVATLSHATLGKLQNALREAADPAHPHPFHILHFIGHGAYDPVTKGTVLLFEDESGQIDAVDPAALVDVLRPFDLKLVFLNACQSAQSSALDLAQGFAPTLLANGIPAVIGMQTSVLDDVAASFARRFYEGLADNQPVDAALTGARQLAAGAAYKARPVWAYRSAIYAPTAARSWISARRSGFP